MKSGNSFFQLFFGVLIRPKRFLQIILKNNNNFYVWPMISVFSLTSSFNGSGTFLAQINALPIPFAFLMEVVLGTSQGFVFFLAMSWIFYLLGKLIGGKGTYKETMTAVAWGIIPPFSIGMLLNLIEVIPDWVKYLNGNRNMMALTPEPLFEWHTTLLVLDNLIFLWALILTLSTLSMVNKFNFGKWMLFFFMLFGILGLLFVGIQSYMAHKQTRELAQAEYEKGNEFLKQKKYKEAMWTYQGTEGLSKKIDVNLLNLAQKKEWICRAYLNDWTPSEGPRIADVRQIRPEIFSKFQAELSKITPVPQVSK
jgi:hypothetical protein